MIRILFNSIVLLICQCTLSGCANSPPVQLYQLSTLKPTIDRTIITHSPLQIGIGPILVPTLLEREEIVTRSLDNRVYIDETQHWGTSFPNILMLALTQNISALKSQWLVRSYPWSQYGLMNYQVLIDITRLEATPTLSAELDANWSIINESNRKVISQGRSHFTQALPENTYPATVNALSKLIIQLSRELTNILTQIETAKPLNNR